MYTKIIFVLFLSIISLMAEAQSRKFENIVDLQLKNSGVIEREGSISGYYLFYSIGNAKKGLKTFVLQILDENLTDVNTTSFEESKRSYLIEANYNGENILMKMWDAKNERISLLAFNTKGELLKRLEQDEEVSSMHAVNDQGFVDYQKGLNSKIHKIQFIPNYFKDDTVKNGWVYTSPEIKKNSASGDLLCVTNDIIVSLISNRRSEASAKIEFEIQGLRIEDGTEVFRVPLSGNYNNQPLLGFYDDLNDKINILGLYYSPDVKALKDNGIGMFNMELNLKGEIVNQKNMAWTDDFRKFVKIDNSGKLMSEDQKGFMFFHKIVRHEDGSILAVAEQYQKVADAAGIAVNILSAALTGSTSASTTKIQVYDMVLFHFNPDFTIRDVKFIPKTKSNITIPEGYDFTNVHLLADYVKSIGGFDYLFTTQNHQVGTTSFAYLDYVKRDEGAPRQWVFNAVTLYDENFVADKLNIGRPSDAKNMIILPAKPGHILILELNKEDESFEMYLEKINY